MEGLVACMICYCCLLRDAVNDGVLRSAVALGMILNSYLRKLPANRNVDRKSTL